MKAKFSDFIDLNKNCSKYQTNKDMQELFALLSTDEYILKMVEYADSGKPALAGVVLDIEQWHDAKNNCLVDFTDSFTKTAVGRMVKTIIAPFGYVVTKQKDMPRDLKTKYFTSASCYEYDDEAPKTMKIVKRIVEL